MLIKELTVGGLGSFKQETTFKFSKQKTYLVTGLNGAGKSTFFVDSLCWLLYGKIHKDGMTVANLINDDSTKCFAQVKLKSGSIIRRERLTTSAEIRYRLY